MTNKKEITKAVILAGGKGTRMPEQTQNIPKPLVQVGPYPIIVHIMRTLQRSGIKEFIICGGYKIEELIKWFLENKEFSTNVPTTDEYLKITPNSNILPDCNVLIVDTGEETGTAQRIKLVEKYLDGEDFVMTYGDSYSDVDFRNGCEYFTEDKVISICGIPYYQRFGLMKVEEDGSITDFKEKEVSKTHFINGGFMLMKNEVFNYIEPEHFDFSKDTLESSRLKGKLSAYIYDGYWKAVDTQSDLNDINKDYLNGKFN